MPRSTDVVGLAGSAVAIAAALAALAARAGARPKGRLALAALGALLALTPFGTLSLAGQLRGVVGDLSLTSVVLLARSVWRRARGAAPPPPQDTLALEATVAAGGLVLYPLTLGLGLLDPYRLGYGSPWLLGVLLALALAGVALELPLVTASVALAVLGWAVGACESRNLWDYLLDPLVWTWALGRLARRATSAAARWRRREAPAGR